MKMKSTLWALAFACAAVSCSDDFEDPNKGGEGPGTEGNGAKAMMNVTISTDAVTKAMTKASDDPEEGDGDEKGSIEESKVEDLCVFLFDAEGKSSTDNKFFKTNPIVAKGYWSVDKTTDSDHPDKHGYEASVEVTFEDDASDFAGKTYGVIAVVNAGNITSSFNLDATGADQVTISKLADHIRTSAYTNTSNSYSKFVMSSHMLDDGDTHNSYVTLPEATDAQDVPEATVFVERLAAKVRISYATTKTDFIYNIAGSDDKVRLDSAAIVNQLSSGSYLLKRATEDEFTNLDIPGTADNDSILIEEAYTAGPPATANFVIDPWTRDKVGATVFGTGGSMPSTGSIQLSYKNPFNGTDYTDLFSTIKGKTSADEKFKQLAGNTAFDADDKNVLLAYTMENTTDTLNSKNGFSTGAFFKATYFAKEVTTIQDDNRSVKATATSWDGSEVTGDAPTFYTYGLLETKFAGLNDIFAYTLAKQVDLDQATEDELKGCYFFDKLGATYDNGTKEAIDTLHIATFMASKTFEDEAIADPFGYMAYLREHLVAGNTSATGVDVKFADVKEMDENGTAPTQNDLKTFSEFIADWDNYADAGIKPYINGTCYYLYWIRHENNDNNSLMGPMEFAIVRNNIYDLSVGQISGLGLSGVDVPDPNKPNEDGDAKMKVVVKVKNWVVRKNNDVII